MKFLNISLLCLIATSAQCQFRVNKITTNTQAGAEAYISMLVMSPTGGITAAQSTNIAAYQAKLATNFVVLKVGSDADATKLKSPSQVSLVPSAYFIQSDGANIFQIETKNATAGWVNSITNDLPSAKLVGHIPVSALGTNSQFASGSTYLRGLPPAGMGNSEFAEWIIPPFADRTNGVMYYNDGVQALNAQVGTLTDVTGDASVGWASRVIWGNWWATGDWIFDKNVYITNGVLHLGASSFEASNHVAGTDFKEGGVNVATLATNNFYVKTNLSVTGNQTNSGVISASAFYGDGSHLTGVSGGTNGVSLSGTNTWTAPQTFSGGVNIPGTMSVGTVTATNIVGDAGGMTNANPTTLFGTGNEPFLFAPTVGGATDNTAPFRLTVTLNLTNDFPYRLETGFREAIVTGYSNANEVLAGYDYVRHDGSGTVTNATSVKGVINSVGPGEIGVGIGFKAIPSISSNGNIGSYYGFHAANPTKTGTGRMTNYYGLLVDPITTVSGPVWGAYLGGTNQAYIGGRLYVADSAAQGSTFDGEVNVTALKQTSGAGYDWALENQLFRMDSGVQVSWSSGSTYAGTHDVGLKRDSAGVLKVTDGYAGSGLGTLLAGTVSSTNLTMTGSGTNIIGATIFTNGVTISGTGTNIFGASSFTNGVYANSFNLTTPVWKDYIMQVAVLSKGGTAVKRELLTPTGILTCEGWQVGTYGDGEGQFNHDAAVTNAAFPNYYIAPHLHLSVTNLPANTSNATFAVFYNWCLIGSTFTNAVTGAITNTITFTTPFKHELLNIGNITNNLASGTISSIFSYRLIRYAAATGDVGDAAGITRLHDFDIHYPVNRLGSSGPATY